MGGSAIHALLRALANETWQALTHMTCFWEVDMSEQRRVPRFSKMGVCLAGMGATPGATPQKEKVAVSAASPPSVDFSTEQVLACVQLVAQSVMVSISTIATGSFAFAFAEQRPPEAEDAQDNAVRKPRGHPHPPTATYATLALQVEMACQIDPFVSKT